MIFGVVEENNIKYTKNIVSKYEDLEKCIIAIWFSYPLLNLFKT